MKLLRKIGTGIISLGLISTFYTPDAKANLTILKWEMPSNELSGGRSYSTKIKKKKLFSPIFCCDSEKIEIFTGPKMVPLSRWLNFIINIVLLRSVLYQCFKEILINSFYRDSLVFKTRALNHSTTPPGLNI